MKVHKAIGEIASWPSYTPQIRGNMPKPADSFWDIWSSYEKDDVSREEVD